MALHLYQQQTQRLIRDIAQKDINLLDLVGYINEARTQLAGEAMCIRVMGSLDVTIGTQGPYAFSSISLTGGPMGVAGILSIATIWFVQGVGQVWVRPRPWPWFSLYELNNPNPRGDVPNIWSQYGQGENGTIYFNMPDTDYTIIVDTIAYPAALVDDTTVEAIPAPWTTAIPYYSAYLAMLSMQTRDAEAAADKMLQRYELFVSRARQFTTSPILPHIYSQSPDKVREDAKRMQQGGAG